MGIVRKQSILSSIFTYIGFAIGAVNILFLFPKYFTPEEIGLTRILLDVALLFSTICSLGAVPLILKFYPFYKRYVPNNQIDLPVFSFGLGLLGILAFILLLPELKPWIIRKFGSRSPLFVDYFDLLYPFTITLTLFSILEAFAWSIKKTVLSNLLKEFSFRLLTTVLILLFILNVLNYSSFITAFAWIYSIPVLFFIYSLNKEKALPLNFNQSSITRRLYSKMLSFAGFLFSASILNIIARTNDTIILASQSSGGLSDAAVFTIATYLVTVMEVPQRSLVSIATPFISEAIQNRNWAKIDRLYKKTSLNLMIAGMGIFGVILLNLDTIYLILGPSYAALSGIVIISGIAKLIDLSTGMNTQILLLSKYWRLDFFTNILLVLLSIPLNYFLTKKYNSIGPAYGNLIAMLVFNLVRFSFLWKLFKIQPFTIGNLKIILVFTFSLFLSYWIPDLPNLYINLILKSMIFLVLYGFIIIRWQVSDDIIDLYNQFFNKFSFRL